MMYMDTKDGHMLTDLVEIGGKKYYFASNGLMQRGMIPLNGKIYLFGADGAMQYGFLQRPDRRKPDTLRRMVLWQPTNF